MAKFQLGIAEDGRIAKRCVHCDGTGHVTYRTPKGYTKTVRCKYCDATGIMFKIA